MEAYVAPHSVEAEKAVLGAILRNPEQFDLIVDRSNLSSQHFFVDTHRHIYEAIVKLNSDNQAIDFLTVAEALLKNQKFDREVGVAFLIDLAESCPVTQNSGHYAALVKKYYFLRRIIVACQETSRKAMNAEGDVSHFIENIEREFLEITKEQDTQPGLVTAKSVLIPTLEELEKRINTDGSITGVTSGMLDLDNATSGWQKSDLIIVAGRPGMGKTALALNWALNAVRAPGDRHIAIFTLEMSKEQLLERLLSTMGRIDSTRLRKGTLSEGDQDRLMQAARQVNEFGHRLLIDETPAITITELRSRCRRFKKEYGRLDMIIIDYLQLMTGSPNARQQGREREIGEISMGLKALAKELNVPVIAAAQLNRGPDARPDKRPKISDLRESGSMEQDADLIMFVYRDEYYNPNSEHAGKAEVILAKNRHGQTGNIYLAWLPNFLAFHNLLKD